MRAQVLCLGAIERRARFHRDASGYCSVTLLSLRPLRSPQSYHCERQAASTAERAELWGEGHGADEGAGLVFWRDRALFEVSS